jgi:hypothetical protein
LLWKPNKFMSVGPNGVAGEETENVVVAKKLVLNATSVAVALSMEPTGIMRPLAKGTLVSKHVLKGHTVMVRVMATCHTLPHGHSDCRVRGSILLE